MGNIHLTVIAGPGAYLPRICDQMQALADRLGIDVEATFNDTTLIARPGGSAEWLAENFHTAGGGFAWSDRIQTKMAKPSLKPAP